MRKKIRDSLFAKVLIITAILLAGMSFLVYAVLAWYTPKTYSNSLNTALDEQVKSFISEISQVPMQESGKFFDHFLDNQIVEKMELYTEGGQREELPTQRNAVDDFVMETSGDYPSRNNGAYHAPVISNDYSVSFPDKNVNYTLVVYGAAGQVAELQWAFRKVLPALALIVFLVSFISAWIFSRLITKPVLRISRISKEMSELKFEWQPDGQRSDELGILEKSLNDLSWQLSTTLNDLHAANKKLELDIEHEKALEHARLDFFSAVSHELKTPITIIKGQLEGMLLDVGAYKDHKKYLTRALEIANMLETMVQEILTVSRLETTGADFKKDRLDCVQMIQSYLRETEDFITKKELQIYLELPSSALIYGNKILMEKVFFNLIGNAIIYSPRKAVVSISVFMENERLAFSIENEGVHIPEDSIAKIFEPFYRVDQSRSRKTGGSGLGLYVTQRILNQHGSECTVENTLSGVRFSFII